MHRYWILVEGQLGTAGRFAFAELDPQVVGSRTALAGYLDQAALFGILERIRAFGLELVEVIRVGPTA